ncbi:hypothetical protein NQ317_013911 [Molorchus minor]|uniref:Uncharacterized protein n=1 Tax=Molorchus minor TaxID=1323400 RepID=A0ABQ9K5Y2_9CUCU|nr:hypothetical protein NQ317_013911 [Molorchus minor]
MHSGRNNIMSRGSRFLTPEIATASPSLKTNDEQKNNLISADIVEIDFIKVLWNIMQIVGMEADRLPCMNNCESEEIVEAQILQ